MFLKIDSQISDIKNKRFPSVDIYKAYVNSSGTDNIINFSLYLNENNKSKVFNNKLSKYLKLKVFLINNKSLESRLETIKLSDNYLLIEQVIQNEKLLNVDVNVLSEAITTEDNELLIAKKFIIPNENIEYLSFGHYFYYDLQEYISDFSLNEKFINKKIFWKELLIISLFEKNTSINESVADLRRIKSVLNNNSPIQNLNVSLDLEQILSKKLKESKILQSNIKFFSNPYITKDYGNNLSFVFNMNYKNIILKNSLYDNILNKTIDDENIKNIYSKINKISNIKILRKQKKSNVGKNGKLYSDILGTDKVLCVSSFNDNDTMVSYKSIDSNFEEINTNNSFSENVKTFLITDKKAYKNGGGIFDYGVEATINNDLNLLYKYLTEHLSRGTSVLNELKSLLENPKYYNALDDTLSQDSLTAFREIFESERLANTLDSFIIVLKIFGISVDEQLLNTIKTIFDINQINVFSMQYFIKMYEKVQYQLIKITEQKYQNTFTITHWFNTPFITNKNQKYGYEFLSDVNKDGFPIIDTEQYIRKINSEVSKYSTANISDEESNIMLYSYITPSYIRLSNNQRYNLDSITNPDNFIQNIEYSKIVSDIKKINIFDDANSNVQISGKKTKNKSKNPLTDAVSFNAELLANKFSITTNLLNRREDNKEVLSVRSLTKDEAISTNSLMMQMIVNLTTDNTKVQIPNYQINGVASTTTLFNELNNFAPMHIVSLRRNTTNIFSSDDLLEYKYLKNIELYSKFMLLYNIIHKVEYLEYNPVTGEENWNTLSKTGLDNFSNNSVKICRLVNYKNQDLNIYGIENLDLPIYGQYFLIKINNSNISTNPPVQQSKVFVKLEKLQNTTADKVVDFLNKNVNVTNINISFKVQENIKKFFNKKEK